MYKLKDNKGLCESFTDPLSLYQRMMDVIYQDKVTRDFERLDVEPQPGSSLIYVYRCWGWDNRPVTRRLYVTIEREE